MSSTFLKKKWPFLLAVSAILLFTVGISFSFTTESGSTVKSAGPRTVAVLTLNNQLYDSLHLNEAGLSRSAFDYGVTGFNRLLESGKLQNDSILSIIDFSLPSGKKRLFVLNVKSCNVLFNTYVSHGKNSGKATATAFSNAPDSYKSSLGFYITGDTYKGQHGYSLRLTGEEKGINDNAFNRGIVMHSACYVDESIAKKQGFIGRSQGCPAIPASLHKSIIAKIKDGSCLFLYSPDKVYAINSKMIQPVTG